VSILKKLKRCTICLLPETKPGLTFNERGVCSACQNFEDRSRIQWDERAEQLGEFLEKNRGSYCSYDCIIPVSGGKDSFFQVHMIKEKLGLHPLLVTATTCHPSELGKRNLATLQSVDGVDSIQVTTDARVRRWMNKVGLLEYGDISLPEHISIFTIPVQVAVRYGIKTIVWGENPQNEYGTGPKEDAQSFRLDKEWVDKHGGLLGVTPHTLVDRHGYSYDEMLPYLYPKQEEIDKVGVTGIFLGHFVPWDGFHNSKVAKKMGFESHTKIVEGSACNYENLDNLQTGIHDYFKWLKFGFGRATDICSSWIRRGYITRNIGFEIVAERDGTYPYSYLDVPLDEILGHIGLMKGVFNAACGRHRNAEIHNE